jgi:hypothetical protein
MPMTGLSHARTARRNTGSIRVGVMREGPDRIRTCRSRRAPARPCCPHWDHSPSCPPVAPPAGYPGLTRRGPRPALRQESWESPRMAPGIPAERAPGLPGGESRLQDQQGQERRNVPADDRIQVRKKRRAVRCYEHRNGPRPPLPKEDAMTVSTIVAQQCRYATGTGKPGRQHRSACRQIMTVAAAKETPAPAVSCSQPGSANS